MSLHQSYYPVPFCNTMIILVTVVPFIFSTNLTYQIAEATANEVRAHYNTLSSAKTFYGLTCFSPVINIMRHPLWGRNQVWINIL